MIKFKLKYAAFIICATLTACSGLTNEPMSDLYINGGENGGNNEGGNNGGGNNGGGNNGGGDTPGSTSDFTISVDKEEIESDGKDAATFIIKDGNGTVVSTPANVTKCFYYYNEDNSMLKRRTTSFTSAMDGSYEIYGVYDGHRTQNTVTITSKNRSKYEKFNRKVGVFQLTGTWCMNCPSMTSGLESVPEPERSHMTWLAFHGEEEDPFRVPYNGTADMAQILGSMMGAQGYPTTVYNLNTFSGTFRDGRSIGGVIREQILNYPATSGVRVVESKIDQDKMTIRAAIKADKGGDFNLGFAILLDGETASGGYERVYNRIVVAAKNFNKYNVAERISLKADEEVEKEFEVSGNLLAKKDKLTVCVFSIRKESSSVQSQSIVDNIDECKMGQSTDYHYN